MIRLQADRRRSFAHEETGAVFVEWATSESLRRQDAQALETADEQRMNRRLGGDDQGAFRHTRPEQHRRMNQRVKSAGACGRERCSRAVTETEFARKRFANLV